MFQAIPLSQSEFRSSTWPISAQGLHFTDIAKSTRSEKDDTQHESTPAHQEEDAHTSQSSSTLRFEPIEPPDGYTPLTFLPVLLQGWALWSLVSFYTVISAILAYLFYRSMLDYRWTVHDVDYYLTARYLPTIVGLVSSALFHSTMSNLRRILPFICMADQHPKRIKNRNSQIVATVSLRLFPTLLRYLNLFGTRAMLLNIGLKSLLFSVQETDDHIWVVSVRVVPAMYLSINYLAIALITAYVALKYGNCSTGLKKDWDPTSLADIMLLFSTEYTKPKLDFPLDHKSWYKTMKKSGVTYRLGYWKVHCLATPQPDIVYGIRSLDDTLEPSEACAYLNQFNEFFNQQGSLEPYCRHLVDRVSVKSSELAKRPRSGAHELLPTRCCAETPGCSHYPYRKAPGIPSKVFASLAILYLIVVCVCLVFALIRIWTSEGVVLQLPRLLVLSTNIAVSINSTSLTSTGDQWPTAPSQTDSSLVITLVPILICRFLPVMTMNLANFLIADLDTHHRWSQPFACMYAEPSFASQSILLDYMTVSPLQVLSQAWANGHFKVVYSGILNALSWIPTLIATGFCSFILTDIAVVRLSPTLAVIGIFWALLYIHAISSYWAPPERKLPRDIGSLYAIFCFIYDSKFRWYSEFCHATFSPNLTKDELYSLIRLSSDKYRFGMVGELGEEHPGFDVAETSDGADTGYVRWIKPHPGFFARVKSRFQRRKSKMERGDDVFDPEGIPLNYLNASTSTSHQRRLSAEDPYPQGHSTAFESESIQSFRVMADL